MSVSIKYNSDYIVEFDQFSIDGREAAGGYAFNFGLTGRSERRECLLSIFDISLSLSLLSSPVKPIITSIPSLNQKLECHTFSNSEQLNFAVIFTKEQINAIEEYRQEKNLTLKIELRALTSSGNTVLSSFDSADVVFPREDWLDALKCSGFRQTLLFEVPLPLVSDELIKLISKAQEFIETGHYKESVMQCRHIIEQVETSRGDKQLAANANNMSQNKQDREKMTVVERMLSLRQQFKNICHLGAHGSEGFTRSQAKAVLGMAMALLAEPTVGLTSKE